MSYSLRPYKLLELTEAVTAIMAFAHDQTPDYWLKNVAHLAGQIVAVARDNADHPDGFQVFERGKLFSKPVRSFGVGVFSIREKDQGRRYSGRVQTLQFLDVLVQRLRQSSSAFMDRR